MSRLDEIASSYGQSRYIGPWSEFVSVENRYKPTVGDNIVRILPDFADKEYDPAIDEVICFKIPMNYESYSVFVSLGDISHSDRPLVKAWKDLMFRVGGMKALFGNKSLRQYFYKTYPAWVVARPVIKSSGEQPILAKKNVPLVATFGYGIVTALKGAATSDDIAYPFHPQTGFDFSFKMEKMGAAAIMTKYTFLGFSRKPSEIPELVKMEKFIKDHPLKSLYYKPDLKNEEDLAQAWTDVCHETLQGGYDTDEPERQEKSSVKEKEDDFTW